MKVINDLIDFRNNEKSKVLDVLLDGKQNKDTPNSVIHVCKTEKTPITSKIDIFLK